MFKNSMKKLIFPSIPFRIMKMRFSNIDNLKEFNYKTFLELNTFENKKIDNFKYSEKEEHILYLNQTQIEVQEEWGKMFRGAILTPIIAGVLFYNGNFLLMSPFAAYAYVEIKKFVTYFPKIKKICHRIVYNPNPQFLSLYMVGNPDDEIKIIKEKIVLKNFFIGLDPLMDKIHKSYAKRKNISNFEINRFKIVFDAEGEDGVEWKNIELTYGENECDVENWNIFFELFGIDYKK